MRKLITTIALAATCITGAHTLTPNRHFSPVGSVSANRTWVKPAHTTSTSIVLANRSWSGVSPDNRNWSVVSPNHANW